MPPGPGRLWARALAPVRAAVLALVLALVPVLVLSGCGTGGVVSSTTGVDRLVVPTPSPRPQDFVDVVDNPWLSWRPGATTTYAAGGARIEQQVARGATRVAGLLATTVVTTTPTGVSTDYFAQDRAGNVWWLGREGGWRAGEEGATAGLWMPAEPRTGDGFRLALAPGVVEEIAEVDLAPPAEAPGEPAGDEVRLRVRSDLDPGRVEVRTYVAGTGLVSRAVTGAAPADPAWSRLS